MATEKEIKTLTKVLRRVVLEQGQWTDEFFQETLLMLDTIDARDDEPENAVTVTPSIPPDHPNSLKLEFIAPRGDEADLLIGEFILAANKLHLACGGSGLRFVVPQITTPVVDGGVEPKKPAKCEHKRVVFPKTDFPHGSIVKHTVMLCLDCGAIGRLGVFGEIKSEWWPEVTT